MNAFTITSSLILFGLAFLCFLIPFLNGQKQTGIVIGAGVGLLIISTFTNADYLSIVIWPIVLVFQIIFLTYWTFKTFRLKKTGQIAAAVLTIGAILLVMQPWIADWTFNKKDVRKILAYHNLELKESFEILKNESGGFRDYYEMFTLKISDSDFNRIAKTIKTSKNYKGFFTDYANLPLATHNSFDTVDFETENHLEREYFTNEKMENGTYHFRLQLDKRSKELSYIGSDE